MFMAIYYFNIDIIDIIEKKTYLVYYIMQTEPDFLDVEDVEQTIRKPQPQSGGLSLGRKNQSARHNYNTSQISE